MPKVELIYNRVNLTDKHGTHTNTIVRILNSTHAEELLAIENDYNAIVAPASPLACPIVYFGSHIKSNEVEKMGYYISLWNINAQEV